jgi:hypothetical protein
MKFAALEPILAILVAVGWFIVKALLDRRRDADEWTEMELPRPTRPAPSPPPPPIHRTLPQGPRPANVPPPTKPQAPRPPQPPPVIRRQPVLVTEEEGPLRPDLATLKDSQESYARALHLQETIASRLSAIDQQTSAPKATQPHVHFRSPAASNVVRAFRNPNTIRQAILAQLVLNPPKALE